MTYNYGGPKAENIGARLRLDSFGSVISRAVFWRRPDIFGGPLRTTSRGPRVDHSSETEIRDARLSIVIYEDIRLLKNNQTSLLLNNNVELTPRTSP